MSYHIKINLTTNHYYKLLWSNESFEVKISQSKKKILIKSVHKQEIGLLWSSESFQLKYNIGFGILIDFPSQRKKYLSNRSIKKKLDFCGPVKHLR